MIEIIAATIEDVKRIEESGADRIELISALSEGGLTPSYALIKRAVQSVKIPVNVMIRPHGKSFIYTDDEIELMVEDIIIAKELNVNGVVFGVLNRKNEICVPSLEKLLKACDGIDVTFHRAIDELLDPVKGIEVLANYDQIKNVLTSGGKGDILKNIPVIKNMVEKSKHINVIVGGGLNIENIKDIIKKTKAPAYHFGTAVRNDKSVFGEINIDSLKILVNTISKQK
ncbi:copper homeostasis protein CutC [Clostridium estertheticum]|uniref:copper homeostasis protein CutC n=1 Tax=Clostridium estertheticum TaxID=238834 RepID=UPI001CF42E2A|nr:copper homeostasis protein CutC [Clostridium estertheticum]MCB2307453.1 copper homeostasis protein CutC [Clostridium estertheticum]MCB2345710.1 copper homeostasis protein CutC [Clostridium estertheticum]MCB2350942.1 copper homeostasis protein CutC [Clostridium estertheticum]WAG44076.1 copper homeostasis protein CutC [Clostridium estertheticum]